MPQTHFPAQRVMLKPTQSIVPHSTSVALEPSAGIQSTSHARVASGKLRPHAARGFGPQLAESFLAAWLASEPAPPDWVADLYLALPLMRGLDKPNLASLKKIYFRVNSNLNVLFAVYPGVGAKMRIANPYFEQPRLSFHIACSVSKL